MKLDAHTFANTQLCTSDTELYRRVPTQNQHRLNFYFFFPLASKPHRWECGSSDDCQETDQPAKTAYCVFRHSVSQFSLFDLSSKKVSINKPGGEGRCGGVGEGGVRGGDEGDEGEMKGVRKNPVRELQ